MQEKARPSGLGDDLDAYLLLGSSAHRSIRHRVTTRVITCVFSSFDFDFSCCMAISTDSDMVLLFILIVAAVNASSVMPWFCLERCQDTNADIENGLEQVAQLKEKGCLASVAFELYNLGPNGTLVTNKLTPIGPRLVALGVEAIPMISSFPYPPQFLEWMRQLWTSQQMGDAFLAQLKSEAEANGWSGYRK